MKHWEVQHKYLGLTLCQIPHAACCCGQQLEVDYAADIGLPVFHQQRALEVLFWVLTPAYACSAPTKAADLCYLLFTFSM